MMWFNRLQLCLSSLLSCCLRASLHQLHIVSPPFKIYISLCFSITCQNDSKLEKPHTESHSHEGIVVVLKSIHKVLTFFKCKVNFESWFEHKNIDKCICNNNKEKETVDLRVGNMGRFAEG